MKTLTPLMLLAGLLSAPLAVMAADSPHSVSGNVSLNTDYRFRGVSQTQKEAAIQGGFDYAHASGLYLGTWASNVSETFIPGANMELDIYGGYSGKVSDDLSYNVGLLQYYYPGSSGTPKANTLEAYGGATWKWLNAKLSYTLSDDWFGVANGDGSTYLEANANFELPGGFGLGLHIGDTNVSGTGNSTADYSDWKVSVSKELGGFNFSLAYVDTDTNFYTAGGKQLGDSTVVLSVGKSF